MSSLKAGGRTSGEQRGESRLSQPDVRLWVEGVQNGAFGGALEGVYWGLAAPKVSSAAFLGSGSFTSLTLR